MRYRSALGAFVIAAVALSLVAIPAYALIILPVFDTCWTIGCTLKDGTVIAPAPAGATTNVSDVITEFENDFKNTGTVKVEFDWGNIVGFKMDTPQPAIPLGPGTLGATIFPQVLSSFPTPANQYNLADTKKMLTDHSLAHPENIALKTAVTNLPATYPCPTCVPGNGFFVPDAQFIALNNGKTQNNNAVNAEVGMGNRSDWNFTDNPGATEFDFDSVLRHEIAHALARVDYAFTGTPGTVPPFLTVLDFYKYLPCTPGSPPNPDRVASCFSIDGGNTSSRIFDTLSDTSDWTAGLNDAFDAFLFPGEKAIMTPVDIAEMNALGWDPPGLPPRVPEPGTPALFATSLFGLAVALFRRRR